MTWLISKLFRAQANDQSSTNGVAKTSPTVMQFLGKEATINKDFSLTLVLNDVPTSNESFLRENLAKKIEKGTLYSSSGHISAFNLGLAICLQIII